MFSKRIFIHPVSVASSSPTTPVPRFPLIVGLGNPGPAYQQTRHNLGFLLLDRLAAAEGVAFAPAPRWQCHLAKLPDGTLLAKPQTFMNLSGQAVGRLARFHRWQPAQILVLVDDVSLPLGTLRFREKGSAGGHNGLKSIIEHLGTGDFPRLKLGIGASGPGQLVGHVLGSFAPEELPELENMLATALEAVQCSRSQGIAAAANRYHPRPPSQPPPHDESQIPRPDRPEHEDA